MKLWEDGVPANNVSGGNIAGVGVGPQGEPPGIPNAFLFKKKKLSDIIKRKPLQIKEEIVEDSFAGNPVFHVDTDTFHKCKMGKRKYARWANYVGKDDLGNKIRDYGAKYPHRPIILQDKTTGYMLHLRYGRKH